MLTLVDLAVIDARLRIIAIEMALNIEHFAKVSLVNDISQDSSEDGYKIVDDYLTGLDDKQRRHLDKAIEDHGKSEYCGDLIKKYDGKYPIWVFVEILGFGDFIYFYKFCAHKYSNRQMINNFYLMLNVKSIRNAAAHNNCIINDFLGRDSEYATNYFLVNALSRSGNISKQVRDTQLKKMRMQQIITLLYTHKTIVTSAGVHQHIAERLNDLSKRIFRNYDYRSCEPLQRSLEFINKVIDDWFKIS